MREGAYIVLVDWVCSTGCTLLESISAGDLGSDSGSHGLRPLAGSGGVDDGLEGAGSISGDSTPVALDGRVAGADLGKGRARKGHGLGQVGELVVASFVSEAKVVVGIDVLGPEDGGVGLSHIVWAFLSNDGASDAKRGTIATEVASQNIDFAVGGNERSSGQRAGDDDLSVHSIRLAGL